MASIISISSFLAIVDMQRHVECIASRCGCAGGYCFLPLSVVAVYALLIAKRRSMKLTRVVCPVRVCRPNRGTAPAVENCSLLISHCTVCRLN